MATNVVKGDNRLVLIGLVAAELGWDGDINTLAQRIKTELNTSRLVGVIAKLSQSTGIHQHYFCQAVREIAKF